MLNSSLLIAIILDNVYMLIIPINTSMKEKAKNFNYQIAWSVMCPKILSKYASRIIVRHISH